MNERTKQLVDQFASNLLAKSGYDLREFEPFLQEAEKFAESIMQKCISEIALIGISNFENEDISWTVRTAIDNIKEHFGVEE